MASNQESHLQPYLFDTSSIQKSSSSPLYTQDESVEILSHSIDSATKNFVFDSDVLYSQPLDACEPHSLDAYNTSTLDSFSFGDDLTTDSFPEQLSFSEGFSDISNLPFPTIDLLPTQNEAQIDALLGVTTGLPNQLLNSQGLNPDGQELASQPVTIFTGGGLPRRRSRYFVSRSDNKATSIPISNTSDLDPMQRWQESPPEDDPASLTAIMNALKKKSNADQQNRGRRKASHRYRRSMSATSRESSASSTDSAWSSAGSLSHIRNRKSQARVTKSHPDNGKPRIFCCTFCCDRFGSRFEWVRHEKSLHLNLEMWFCAPFGPSVFSSITGKEHCAFCNTLEPSQEHLFSHNYESCQSLSKELRSFRRKDHLVQHLRRVHKTQELPLLDDCKIEVKSIISRCGFCDITLDNWDDRISHLAKHFRRGYTMKDWKGDHEFPPHIAAQVTNAYPPYLIGWESECIIPFSATNTDVRNQYVQVMSSANTPEDEDEAAVPEFPELAAVDETKSQLPDFINIFTRHLSQYARRQMEIGVIPTDEMFQKEARKALFDGEDAWDQTIADNPDWLSAFRRLHCDSTEKSVEEI
ncbi:hypothetical protein GGI43DRAFT_371392 [Trichoderma evansii]